MRRPPRLGVALPPVADHASVVATAQAADAEGLDLIGIPDHPYSGRHLDALTVAADLLARTERVRVFTDVANLPLRPPAVLAKAAASMSLASGGRFDLGLGAGQAWQRIVTLGTPARSPGEAHDALAEAVAVMRALWAPSGRRTLPGQHYSLDGASAGPAPTTPVEVWVGAVFPRMLRLTGAVGDGWAAPIPTYLPVEQWLAAQDHVDDGARAAGRDPGEVRRIAQVVGTLTDTREEPWTGEGQAPVRDTAAGWQDLVARLRADYRFDDVVFWPEHVSVEQVTWFAREVGGAR